MSEGQGLTVGERNTRDIIESLFNGLTPEHIIGTDAIRQKAIAAFTEELNAKLSNLQEGEALQITYRVDIIRSNGKVRGGRGRDRNMPELIAWRKSVFERDHYICQECGATSDLNAHHIKLWSKVPSLRFDVSNGVTLCVKCHQKKHPNIKINGRWGRKPSGKHRKANNGA